MKRKSKSIYIVAWLTIVLFLGWSGNLLMTIQDYWRQTSELHARNKNIDSLTTAFRDLSRPGNDVLENYEVTKNRTA